MRSTNLRFILAAAAMCAMGLATTEPAMAADERQSLEELRNTVINLLQALVDQGVITREKAAQLVKNAQDKAAADAAALAKSDEGAVKVPYVPQIVKDEISKQVAESVKPAVVADVVKEAKAERWGIPGALPDWLKDTRITGQFLLREEALLFDPSNMPGIFLNFYKINQAGGITKAGDSALLNVNENRYRFRGSARVGIETSFSDSITAGVRFATGNSTDLVSPTVTLDGTAPVGFGVDNLFVRFDQRTASRFPWLTVIGGRFDSPWFAPTDLIFHHKLTYNGVAATGRLGFGDGSADQSHVFLTAAAMPLQEVELSSRDKWLYGAQGGVNLKMFGDQRLRLGAAIYDFRNVEGRDNALNSTLNDFTAPQFLRQGNSVFDIRNDNDSTTNLFALSSKFRLGSVSATYDIPFGPYSLGFAIEGVKNFGFNSGDILARTGVFIEPRDIGYQGEISFGTPVVDGFGLWRALAGYRYLQSDAVLDSLTDSDFHLGGTNAVGYYLVGDVGLATHVWVRVRWQSANAIDGPKLGVDTLQIDLNTRF